MRAKVVVIEVWILYSKKLQQAAGNQKRVVVVQSAEAEALQESQHHLEYSPVLIVDDVVVVLLRVVDVAFADHHWSVQRVVISCGAVLAVCKNCDQTAVALVAVAGVAVAGVAVDTLVVVLKQKCPLAEEQAFQSLNAAVYA